MKRWEEMNEEEKKKEIEKMNRNMKMIRANLKVAEGSYRLIAKFIREGLRPEVKLAIKKLAEPMKLSYESSKVNVMRIGTFEEPTKQVSLSNFLFGKMFGKTEFILQLIFDQEPLET